MTETSASLLERLRAQPDETDWQRLVNLYTPLIRNWLIKHMLQEQDRNDVVQEVMTVVIRRIPEFQHNQRCGAFRNWLRTITVNCLREFWRSQKYRPQAGGGSDFKSFLDEMEDPGSQLSQVWNQEHDNHVMSQLLQLIRPCFETKTWNIFQRLVLEGASPESVSREFQVTVNAVFIAKSRVLARLRQESRGLLDTI